MSGDDSHVPHDRVAAHRVTWFGPDRPVEGTTVYARPDAVSPAPEGELEAPSS